MSWNFLIGKILVKAFRIFKISEIETNTIQKAKTRANNKSHPPENIMHFSVLFLLCFILVMLIFSQCLRRTCVLFITNVLHHRVHSKVLEHGDALGLSFVEMTFLEFGAVDLTVEVESFHDAVGFGALVVVNAIKEQALTLLQERGLSIFIVVLDHFVTIRRQILTF